MVGIDSSSGYNPVLLGPFQLINLTLGVWSLPVTAAFTPSLVSEVWQGDKQLQFSNFALIQSGVGGKGGMVPPKMFCEVRSRMRVRTLHGRGCRGAWSLLSV